MNDKIIIKTISKIYFTIVSLFAFSILTLSIIFIILQNGIYIETISFPSVNIKQLYIKWNEKLSISIKEVEIIQYQDDRKLSINYEQINEYFKKITLVGNYFEQILLEKIVFNGIRASFKYVNGENAFISASSPDFSIQGSAFIESNLLNLEVKNFHDIQRNIDIHGNIIFNSDTIELTTSLNLNINDDVLLNLLINADRNRLYYKVNSLKNITDTKHVIMIAPLEKQVLYWVLDAIKMSHLTINSVYGWLDYQNLDEAYKNLYIQATAKKLKYTYNQKLQPITSEQTQIEFKNGILSIHPEQAYTYNFFLDKTWLQIDFTKQQELLTLNLFFDGKLNNDILNLLNTYKIKLPFLQKKGIVKSDLKLEVNLHTIDVNAKGDFYTKEANFDYLGLNIDVYDAHIFLNNNDVKINNMLTKYKDLATANLNVDYNAKDNRGQIKFDVKSIALQEIGISLNQEQKPFNVTYNISPEQDQIVIGASTWNYKNQQINIDKIDLPFNLKKLIVEIPQTFMSSKNIGSAYMSGTVMLNSSQFNIDFDVLKFSYKNVQLSQSNAKFKLNYDKKFTISSENNIQFTLNHLNSTLNNLSLESEAGKFKILHGYLDINTIGQTNFSGNYDFNENQGLVQLEDVKFKNKDLGEIFSDKNIINVNLKLPHDKVEITENDLNISYKSTDMGWMLIFNSLENIAKKSSFLQKYRLDKGSLFLHKKFDENIFQFSSNIQYPYNFLVQNNTPIQNYTISGEIDDTYKDIFIDINNAVQIKIDEEIKINIKDIGVNLNALLDFVTDTQEDSNSSDSNSSDFRNVELNATNSYLFISENRHIVSDTINLQYINHVISAQLKHKNGQANFDFYKRKFNLYGENFGDEFMDNLFAHSKFKDGALTFSMSGTTKEYDGLFYIDNSTILDYKILNNVLAFVNTLPSLVTFSLPGYSTNGLFINSAYLRFHTQNDIFNISDIYVDSKEIDILGRGTASIKDNNVSIELNLKTGLGNNISKIPLVGYILLGKDAISTTLSVTGPLDNPDVTPLLAKEIIVAPLNIIKRTLFLPYHLISDDSNASKKE